METSRKKKFFKKKEGPSFRVFSGYNQRFFSAVNENLDKFLPETEREYYLNRYGRINEDFDYLSPIYFAAAITFLNQNKDGPTTSNFNDKVVDKFVKPNMTDAPPSISASGLNLRRKIELLRYIRLLIKLDSFYYPSESGEITRKSRSPSSRSSSPRSPSPRSPSPRSSSPRVRKSSSSSPSPSKSQSKSPSKSPSTSSSQKKAQKKAPSKKKKEEEITLVVSPQPKKKKPTKSLFFSEED